MWGWDDDDPCASTWRTAVGWAELLIETAGPGRGDRERAARDLGALLIYQAALVHRCRTGLVQVATLQRQLAAAGLAAQLRADLVDRRHRDARACLDRTDPDAGAALLAAAVTSLAQGRPGATAIEDLWPAGTLLARGDRGPTW